GYAEPESGSCGRLRYHPIPPDSSHDHIKIVIRPTTKQWGEDIEEFALERVAKKVGDEIPDMRQKFQKILARDGIVGNKPGEGIIERHPVGKMPGPTLHQPTESGIPE
ncbi:MAG TPA: hypothetical protein VFQ54_12280, partial [Thermomicrobiales bacterium]|nr:hypothetical protein [Thermomicrobiales bacterium]